MERTHISLTTEQMRRLRRVARRRGTSMAALIRDAVDRVYGDEDANDAAWDRALASLDGFRSDGSDVSESHDTYLTDTGPNRRAPDG
jgi:hypothetical protein